MVYCGKPSKGCLSCRSRKTRCDRQIPSCSQCIRAKRECPGYRNQLDLMFRNESETVIGKATSQKARKPKSSSTTTNHTPKSATPSQTPAATSPSRADRSFEFFVPLNNDQDFVPGALSPSLEDRALSFYKNKSAIWLQNFDIVESISNQATTDDYLLSTLSAVGLASYASSVRSPKLMYKARKNYGKALQLTNAALRSPEKYTNDSTLFSVLALGVFEAVAGNGEESMSAWAKHLSGASELVKLRGPAQFMTEAGQRMFIQIGSNLMVDCVQHGRPMPAHIMALRKGSEPFVNTQDPAWRISNTIIMFTTLRATVMRAKHYEPRDIVASALEIDDIFVNIVDEMPATWRYRTIQSNENPDAIWNGVYHVYPDFWVVQMTNTMRIFRIHALQILREQLDKLTPDFERVFPLEESERLRKRALDTMYQMQQEILASAPQYIRSGITSFPADSPDEPWQVYQILWPLFLVGNMDISSQKVSRWVMNRYLVLAKESGVEHAAVFAESMRKRHGQDSYTAAESEQYMAQPLRFDPFDWNLDGWVLAHSVILSAQVNRTKSIEPSNRPKPDLSKIPPGWTGGPPPGWTGGPPPGWTGGPPPRWTGGPPPGWRGGPPPGWKGGPPSDMMPSMNSSLTSPNGPPPGWTGPPPPGWKGGSPPVSTVSPSSTSQSSSSGGPPSGWSGPPPPGWKGGPPPDWQGGPPPNVTNVPPNMPPSNSLSRPPAGWTGPPPPGWVNPTPRPSFSNESTAEARDSISPEQKPSHGFSGPPPGWDGKLPPNITTSQSQRGPPPGWSGPPPPGWTSPTTPPPSTSNSSRSSTDARIPPNQAERVNPLAGFPSPPLGWSGGPPPGWTGGPPPGWSGGPPPGWSGGPPPGWTGGPPPNVGRNPRNGGRGSTKQT